MFAERNEYLSMVLAIHSCNHWLPAQQHPLIHVDREVTSVQGCPEVDLLIRTSGEHRLSDFLLWQSSYAQLVFSNTLWPDYSFWNLLQALVQYQRSYPDLQKLRAAHRQAPAGVSSHCSEGNTLLRQSSSQTPGVAKAGASSPPVSADTHTAVRCGKSGKEAAETEATDIDTSDSSVSSESGPASPSESPARLTRSSGPPQQQAESLIHPGQQGYQSCGTGSCVGQQEHMDLASANGHTAGSKPAFEPGVAHSKVVPRTLYADVDCRTIPSPSLSRRHPYKALKNSPC